jgi:uncharacterized protein (DUF58 family)
VALFFLFLMALAYGHSMAFAATFFLTSLLMSSALLTHLNMKDALVESLKVPSIIRQDQLLSIFVEIQNTKNKNKMSLSLYKLGESKLKVSEGIDLKPLELKKAAFYMEDQAVGVHHYDNAQLMTSFPLGLFYSWMKFQEKGVFYVAPRAINHMQIDPQAGGEKLNKLDNKINSHEQVSQEGDFYEHRHFDVESDSWHRLDWKAYAKRGIFLKKSNASPEKSVWVLDVRKLESLKRDKAYEQMSYWIEECEKKGHRFNLILKKTIIEGLEGNDGVAKALKALSLEAQGESF